MNILIVIGLVGLVFWKLKNYFLDRITIEYNFKFLSLKLKLDLLAIDNNVNAYDGRYKNLNKLISNMIKNLSDMSLTYFIIYTLINRKSLAQIKGQKNKHIQTKPLKEVKFDLEIAKINKEIHDILLKYLIQKAIFLRVIVFVFFWFKPFKHSLWKLKEDLKEMLSNLSNRQADLPFAV